jgi:hypothetical protein
VGILGGVGSEDGGEHIAKLSFQFREAGRVMHFDALALAPDEARFAQDFEMLGEGRLGQSAVVEFSEVGASVGAFRGRHFREDLGADRIG